ncbi:c-type cytochrome [Nisaea acidiphila]|uniref:C-type cytochrome n=1 Tax=Nisaea acidiphila TaxID=1862145 RepID=A0A9J7AMF5_9PROT|nr:c-type cytochrome [Nisaea acidiphila]UUX48640.1 c-type cytochrome [Nisaea acidiphila]
MSRTGDERRARRLARMRARAFGTERRSDHMLRALVDQAEDEVEAAERGLVGRLSRKLGPKGRFLAVATLIAILITAVSIYYDRRMLETAVQANWDDPVLVAEGQTLYRRNCAFCHGDALEGQEGWDGDFPTGHRPALPLDGSAPTWRLSDDDIFDVIKYGGQPFSPRSYKNDMPGFEIQIPDAGIWAIVAFMKSRWRDEVRAKQEEAAASRSPGG